MRTISNATYDNGYVVVLPVMFGDITAIIQHGQLQVNWTTVAETNNDHIIIEASADGTSFAPVREIKSQAQNGNLDTQLQYRFNIDTSASKGSAGLAAIHGVLSMNYDLSSIIISCCGHNAAAIVQIFA